MNRISINREAFCIEEKQLDHGELSIGRADDNDICLDDPALSSHHAKIVTLFNATHVEDLGSTNGTFVNGTRINEHTMHSGDVITLGSFQIAFYSDQAKSAPAADKTIIMSSERLEGMISKAQEVQNAHREQEKLSQAIPAKKRPIPSVQNNASTSKARPAAVKEPKQRRSTSYDIDEISQQLETSSRRHSSHKFMYVFAALTLIFVIVGAVAVITSQ